MRINRINVTRPNITFKNIKNKDVLNTVRKNNEYSNELYFLRREASYEFINGVLTMVDSDSTNQYKKKKEEYTKWLNSEVGSLENGVNKNDRAN